MSTESIVWLNQNVLRGFTDKLGTAWHNRDDIFMLDGLTNHYPGAIPQEDILSRLFNWKAVETPLYVNIDGNMLPVDGKKAFYRSDNGVVLGMHSDKYNGHDYAEWLVENLAKLVDNHGGAQFATAGLLRKGAVAWVQIETPDNVTTKSGLTFRPSILAGTSFDGSLATFYKPVSTIVVCDNTMVGAMGESGAVYRQKHTRHSRFVLSDAKATIDMLERTAETVGKRIDTLSGIPVSESQWSEFLTAHYPLADNAPKITTTRTENIRTALTGMWRTDMRVAPWHGTAFGVLQAVNTFNEHNATMRGKDTQRFERKMLRAIGDDIFDADAAAMTTLSKVIGRELINA